ncbi:unnamed protein product [Urochloa decumbens]|uniref:Protein kinase domain-containing protein n=1 Tax=Urochloa decumbens TaxID=240449 RepID=A0ABC9H5C2_9POAL
MAMELLTLGLLASLLLHAAGAIDNNNISCAPVRCGNLSITYPFSLTGVQQPYCGYPALELACDAAGRAYLSRASRQHVYRVGDISYGNNSMVVAVEAAFAGDAACHVPDFNVSSALSLLPLNISGANRNLVFVYNCAVPPSVRLPRSCANRTMGAYITGRNENWGVPTNCSAVSVPVRGFHDGMELPAKDRYEGLIRDGFEWAAAGDCAACKRKGGECRFVQLSFQCFCPDELLCSTTPRGINSAARKIFIALTVATGIISFACIPCMVIWYGKDQKPQVSFLEKGSNTMERKIEELIMLHGSLTPKRYKYSEVTSFLSNKLGEGGYGTVFRARLHDGRVVAVKLLHDSKGNGDEFVNEVMSIGKTSHVNIVSLFGFCLEGSKRALIYEYMPNGSLYKYIYSENPKGTLGWELLYKIAIGIAHGLQYLHHSCNTRIVHFDIKPQNILLDGNFCPKIADFGLAKLCRAKESKLSVPGARGTIGFIAPEVLSRSFGVVSTKSDVYGYGMMLLEMVGGRKNVKSMVERSSEKYFPDWIYDHFAQDDGLQACEITSEVEEMARRMTLIGLWCIQVLPVHRPTITNVLEMFERRLDELEMPPKQNFCQIVEDSAHNLSTESACATTPSA